MPGNHARKIINVTIINMTETTVPDRYPQKNGVGDADIEDDVVDVNVGIIGVSVDDLSVVDVGDDDVGVADPANGEDNDVNLNAVDVGVASGEGNCRLASRLSRHTYLASIFLELEPCRRIYQ